MSIWMLLTIPSLKLLYSTVLINIGVLFLLVVSALLRKKWFFSDEHKILLGAWSVFSCLILAGFYNGMNLGITQVVDYFYFLIAVTLLILIGNYRVMTITGKFFLGWALFLAVWQITFGVPTSRELGQHYLTVSMPIGAGLSYSLCLLFFAEIKLKKRLLYGFISFILFASLATLLSRSSILFPILIFTIITLLYLFFAYRVKNSVKLKWVGSLLLFVTPITIFLVQVVELRQLYRLVNLIYNLDGESRMQIYRLAIDYIAAQPIIGYGTASSSQLLGSYPHNIFLETLTHGGVLLFGAFIFILFLYVFYSFRLVLFQKRNSYLIGFFALSLFLFFQWNTSFSIRNAYIPIGGIVIFILGVLDFIKLNEHRSKYFGRNSNS